MRIIPVIDLMNGLVVRGIGGRRSEYRPIESRICPDARPATVGRAFRGLGLTEAYVADLDAIAGMEPTWCVYRELADCGLQLWVDAGLSAIPKTMQMAQFVHEGIPLAGVVAGLESLPDRETLCALLTAVGPERFVFSLDLKSGVPLASQGWHSVDVQQIARAALDAGVTRLIVLDLARVGVGDGVGTETLCRWLRAESPRLELTAGGGIRNAADLARLAEAGCNAALVASALHDGRLGPADLG